MHKLTNEIAKSINFEMTFSEFLKTVNSPAERNLADLKREYAWIRDTRLHSAFHIGVHHLDTAVYGQTVINAGDMKTGEDRTPIMVTRVLREDLEPEINIKIYSDFTLCEPKQAYIALVYALTQTEGGQINFSFQEDLPASYIRAIKEFRNFIFQPVPAIEQAGKDLQSWYDSMRREADDANPFA